MTSLPMLSNWRSRVWAWYLISTCALMGLYLFAPGFSGSGPLINALGLSGVVAIVVGIRLNKPRARAAWWLFAAGQFLFFCGDLYTYSYPKLFGADVGFPSIGDALYLAVYPILMAGFVLLVRRRNPRPDRAALIDALILTIGFALLSWVFLIAPNVHLSGLSWLAKEVSVAYPLGDVLLLAAVIRLAVDSGKRTPAFWLLVGSVVSLMATDSAYNYALLKNTFHHQLSFDAGWILYYLLWGAAALHPSMRALEEPASDPRTRLTPVRLILLAGACLIAPAIRFAQSLHNPDVLVLIVASAALFLLVVARMAGLVRQEERAVSRERALRSAGIDLVAAADQGQVAAAAISAVGRLLGPETAARLVLVRDGEAVVEAASDGAVGHPISDGTRAWLRQDPSDSLRIVETELPAYVQADLRLSEEQTTCVSPLVVRDEVRGALVVSSPRIVTRNLTDALGALATQVSLAVEAASLSADLHRRQSEARFRSLVAHSSDLITVLDAEGVITYQSPSIEGVLGYRVDDVEGTRFDRLVSASDRPLLAQLLAAESSRHSEGHTIECSVLHRDGTVLRFEVQHTDLLDDEHVRGLVLNSRDISERKAFEDQLAHQAFHDPVTKLANRALFSDRVEHALMRSTRSIPEIAVMFIDLDDFKTVNDSLGHAAGDEVLREVGDRLKSAVRPTDTVARFGGDEFAVLLDGVNGSEDAADAAARILRALDLPVDIEGKNVFPRASIGICLVGEEETPAAADLLRNADVAMYMAKRDSKGSYRVFESTMHERVVERLELRTDLQHAMALDQLELHYQPVVRLAGREIIGVEALLRWNHPVRGTIPPNHFIPVAEETGLIIPIGRWVLESACREGVRLHQRFPRPEPLTMSVNLSVRQLQSETIVSDVREALAASGLPAPCLVLEITESLMLVDTDFGIQQLHELKSLGVRLAMDDFGTGYSSLSYLSRFPVDILKMDRSFVGSGDNEALTSAIIALGDSLSLDVVAEGIELQEQASSLEARGCKIGQGFLFARPMASGALTDFLTLAAATPGDFASPASSNAA